ncbi:SDR family oxidoreductase [Pseudomonas weihenstephanensis]|uniref:SDR family oxidoreductase n=1 Tax=Pseudomonas weihenstephanensis TaxID=1608994 RepID=UPI00193AE798|nr:SDR family oxidoreductase [Pseudomonas weihenstephanensis]MBM1191077.1 SDR family oxidoreductase [Pseudomonas weihenstephanensis]GLX89608.1 3-ketoacyl-ACP reductase [Pseudomonas fragi]
MTTTPTRVVIITGASRGIGAFIARQLASEGFAVAINYVSSAREASALVVELRQAGHKAMAVQADVANAADVARLFTETEQQLGKVDVLINNAGMLTVMPLAQHSDELYDQTFNINTKGTFNTLREAATRLNSGGRIVNFSSSTVGMNLPGYAVYIASKAAVESLTQVFAKELRGRQITVNAIAPGPVATQLFLQGKTEEQIQAFAKMPPLERLGQPQDIARIVSFLVSTAADWVNGQVLRANGGLV